ncbi:MAG: 3-hydroxyacyl-CoA dehydrogenase NAD-binding domain-containing protein [Dehalococcoidia bacterium]
MPQEQAPHGGGPIPTSATAIAVVGCGYVGLVTAAGFAEQGHRVYAFDSDAERVQALRAGVMPLLEPGLAEACRAAAGRLTFHHTAVESCPR